MIHFCSHTFASRFPKQPPPLQKKTKKPHKFPRNLRRVEMKSIDSALLVPWPPVQLGALLLPDASISPRRPEVGFGVGAHGAPGVLGAGLHDRAGGGAHGADVGRLPQLAHQAIHPVFQLLAGQRRVPLGLLHVAQADRDVEHGVEAVETLLHVAVLGRPVVELQSVICRKVGGDKRGSSEAERRERFTDG